MSTTLTGGCHCGAVRYEADFDKLEAYYCHCRMCQLSFGNIFATFTNLPKSSVRWLTRAPDYFISSRIARRGFCAACGTPLYMLEDGWTHYDMAMAAFDDPAALPAPDHAVGVESKLPWFDRLHTLPARRTDEDRSAGDLAQLKSLQHPDRDTQSWPERRS